MKKKPFESSSDYLTDRVSDYLPEWDVIHDYEWYSNQMPPYIESFWEDGTVISAPKPGKYTLEELMDRGIVGLYKPKEN